MADWVQGRKIRLALFLPQYAEDPVSHEIEGIGTGFLGIELIRSFATSLGIEAQIAGYPTPADVVACLKTGAGDVAFMGIEPSRAAQLDFSPPVFQFEYTLFGAGWVCDPKCRRRGSAGRSYRVRAASRCCIDAVSRCKAR